MVTSNQLDILHIQKDEREILTLRFANGREYDIRTGTCRRIVAYGEPSEFCYVPWFAIFGYSGEIIARVPAGMVEVIYAR